MTRIPAVTSCGRAVTEAELVEVELPLDALVLDTDDDEYTLTDLISNCHPPAVNSSALQVTPPFGLT
jgi:hypothetical protein